MRFRAVIRGALRECDDAEECRLSELAVFGGVGDAGICE
jgi:hypothetical protein